MEKIEMAEVGETITELGNWEIESLHSSDGLIQLEEPTNQNSEGTPEGGQSSQDKLQILLEQELKTIRQNRDNNQPFIIFRVHAHMREKATTTYEPQWVSIGPYHHGKERLRTMEEHKRRCLCDFLDRDTNIGLEVYLKEMRKLERQARQCYSESVKMDSDQFVLMLLMDCCFILEFSRRIIFKEPDALFDSHGFGIRRDLMLFENQVPFFVIHKLFFLSRARDDTDHQRYKCPLLEGMKLCVPYTNPGCWPELTCDKVDHLLHIYYKYIIPEFNIEQINSEPNQTSSWKTRCLSWIWSWLPARAIEESSWYVPPCATVLNESGVIFKRKENPRDMFDITFHDGVMEMPLFGIQDGSKILFSNVLGFEQSQCIAKTFSSFVALMDLLIDTGNDIALLKKSGVIESIVESDQKAADFFNQLGNGCIIDLSNHYFGSLFKQVTQYSNSTWPKQRARLLHDYFSNPWASISVFAGVVLLGLTVTQTYYTIYSAYHH